MRWRAGRYGLLCTPCARNPRTTSSRSWPRGTCTTKTNHPRASRQQVVEPLELGQADRAGDVGEAVVEAEAVVVQPAHVRRAALVALGVDPLLEHLRAHRHHAALAGGDLLVG